jgi:hypothetical protein
MSNLLITYKLHMQMVWAVQQRFHIVADHTWHWSVSSFWDPTSSHMLHY